MRITALHVYPVKGGHALALEHAAAGPLGLDNDRRFAFVAEDGCALTQRDQPLLATISPSLEARAIRLDFAGLVQLTIPYSAFAEDVSVDVWGHQVRARAAPEPLVRAAADYLGAPVRLAALDAKSQRAFVDSGPVLVISSSMLAELNARLPAPVGMERFRPNLVLEGAHDWTRLEGGDVVLERDKPCGRCEVTTIDQATGERRGPEPLRTLSERFAGNFGAYCRVARTGRLRRGEVLQAS